MTTYSVTIGPDQQGRSRILDSAKRYRDKGNLAVARIEKSSVYKLNLSLLIILIVSAVAFVFVANLRVAWEYSLNLDRNKLSALNAQSISQDQNFANHDLEELLLFAEESGMIEAKDVGSILQDGNFAINN